MADILIDADVISLFVASEGKKSKKLTKIVKIKELKFISSEELNKFQQSFWVYENQ